EVSVARDLSDLRVLRVFCVVDCGVAINPAGLEGQIESGITWGLSATLHGKIDFRDGGARQESYTDFAVMRMGEMPAIETHIVPSQAPPSGFGEHAVPPVAPAVANAVSFLETPPPDVARFSGTEPSGCSFWRLASEGRVFYTIPADHFNCPIGCQTHNIPLTPEREKEAGETLKMMFDLGYVRPDELPQIPRLAKTPAAVVSAPRGESP